MRCMDQGFCPVGCDVCHDVCALNGPPHGGHVPVAGGVQNCVRCRFFVTGAPFLIGLQSHLDAVTLRSQELGDLHTAAQKQFLILDQRTREYDDMLHNWHATFHLLEQCWVLLKNPTLTGEADRI